MFFCNEDGIVIFQGLVKNNTLSHFSLEFCRIGDAGLDSKFVLTFLIIFCIQTLRL